MLQAGVGWTAGTSPDDRKLTDLGWIFSIEEGGPRGAMFAAARKPPAEQGAYNVAMDVIAGLRVGDRLRSAASARC
jgi:hypothetical protein